MLVPQWKNVQLNYYLIKKENLLSGSLSKLRKKPGVNLSNNYNPPPSTLSTLHKDIEEFLCQDDVTKHASDKKKQLHGNKLDIY